MSEEPQDTSTQEYYECEICGDPVFGDWTSLETGMILCDDCYYEWQCQQGYVDDED